MSPASESTRALILDLLSGTTPAGNREAIERLARLSDRLEGDDDLIPRVIECLESALHGPTLDDADWRRALVLAGLARLNEERFGVDDTETAQRVAKYYEDALEFIPRKDDPPNWATMKLGVAWALSTAALAALADTNPGGSVLDSDPDQLRGTVDMLTRAAEAFEDAHSVLNERDYPGDWEENAGRLELTQKALGVASRALDAKGSNQPE